MNTRPSLYRSTLITAAVAIGCFGAAAAQAHDHGWHGHDEQRGWRGHERGWRERDWRDRDGDRGDGRRYGYAAPVWREGGVEYLPPVAFYPSPAAYPPGGVSVVVRLPF
jgi:hypothetical protein